MGPFERVPSTAGSSFFTLVLTYCASESGSRSVMMMTEGPHFERGAPRRGGTRRSAGLTQRYEYVKIHKMRTQAQHAQHENHREVTSLARQNCALWVAREGDLHHLRHCPPPKGEKQLRPNGRWASQHVPTSETGPATVLEVFGISSTFSTCGQPIDVSVLLCCLAFFCSMCQSTARRAAILILPVLIAWCCNSSPPSLGRWISRRQHVHQLHVGRLDTGMETAPACTSTRTLENWYSVSRMTLLRLTHLQ